MEGHIGLVTDNPAVMRPRRDVEQFAGAKFGDSPIIEGGGGCAGEEGSCDLIGAGVASEGGRTDCGADMGGLIIVCVCAFAGDGILGGVGTGWSLEVYIDPLQH